MAKIEEAIKLQQTNRAKQDQQSKAKQAQLEKKISTLAEDMDLKNKTVSDKIEDSNKKITQLKTIVDQNNIKST